VNWSKAIEEVKWSLSVVLESESTELAADGKRLELIAGDMVGYWKKTLTGDDEDQRNAERILKHLRSEARLVAEIHGVKARINVERLVSAMSATGLALLKSGLAEIKGDD
jgi:hypothetical protein